MATENKQLLAFNRGVISPRGLARIDLERMAMSAETQSNWVPRVLGSMMLRPGFEYIIDGVNASVKTLMAPFVFSVDDTVMLHFGGDVMRPVIDDEVLTAPAITSVISNQTFGANIAGWTDSSQTGGSVSWLTGGYAGMKGDGTDFGILRQTITIVETGVEQWLSVFIEDGPVRFKLGSTAGDDDYVAETRLDRGDHHFAFTPTGNITIELANEREFYVRVDTVWFYNTAAGGEVTVVSLIDADNMDKLRWSQSGDVIYLAVDGEVTQKVERRGTGKSWSIANYLPEDGPFRTQNVSGITITPSALNGDITLTASEGIFKQEHADNRSIWRIASQGQVVTVSISSGADIFTDPIRIVGSEASRVFTLIISGRTDSTITLQFAFASDGPWNDLAPQYTSDQTTAYDDGQDGQIIYYRLGIKTADYGTDTVVCTLNYTGGSIQGIARVYAFTSSTVVSAQVLKDFGSTDASKDWWEGEWSDHRGWPTSVDIYEGRLWWAGRDKIWASISDAYESFDDNFSGDAGPISRSIGSGPIRIIHWLMSMGRLLFGTAENSANIAPAKIDGNNVLSARSNSFDEPLTPTNFNIKTISSKGVFVDRTLQRLYELTYNIDDQDYRPQDLSIFSPDFNEAGIVKIAVQMKPDVRVHCVRADGTAGVLVYDRLENVICWFEVTSLGASGKIEDVAVLPGVVEDLVYYSVNRTINSLPKRHICKWAMESEAIGGTVNKIADDFVHYSGAPTTTPFTTELLHIRDETVVIWADGIDVGTQVVTAAGALTNPLATAASEVVAGLGYTAQFKGSKLSEVGLLDRKKINRIGFIAQNMHYQGLQYGPDFNNLSDLPKVSRGQTQTVNKIYAEYHEDDFPFGGDWDEDSRICLQAAAPRPCTILAAIAEMQSMEISNPRRRRRS